MAFGRELGLEYPIFTDNEPDGGTAGCIVKKGGVRFILTCRHVVADAHGCAVPGALVRMRGRTGIHEIGVVRYLGNADHQIDDVALVELTGAGKMIRPRLPGGIGRLASPLPLTEIIIGMRVRKYGSRAGLTLGEVAGLSLPVREEPGENEGIIQFVPYYGDHRREKYVKFCSKGDSGSVIVSDSRPARPIGLLQRRGTGVIGRGYASCFAEIQNRLGFEIE